MAHTAHWRLELFYKSPEQLHRVAAFLAESGGKSPQRVNLTMKSKTHRLEKDVEELKLALPQLDVCPHFALKWYHRAREPNASADAFLTFCRTMQQLEVNDVLLLSGSVGAGAVPAQKKHDSIMALQAKACHKELDALRVHCAFNPYFPEAGDRKTEQQRFKQKWATGQVGGIYLQAGSDLSLLDDGLTFLRKVCGEELAIHGSVFLPSKRFLAQMKFRPWNGVFLSAEYYSSVPKAMEITRQVLNMYKNYGVIPLVESNIQTPAELRLVQELLTSVP